MNDSILSDLKKLLGPDIYDEFDTEILIFVNSALAELAQVGACQKGFAISGSSTTWAEMSNDQSIVSLAKSYIYNKARIRFDPPQSSFVLNAMKEDADELLWRINSDAEYT